ncbi:hypothetical protein BDB01DRAFT_811821 [Pilobolus umbonatus]|nr:hypothetical protein BDB01DRAFT_811821 [Pilobolus umbonatus]
MPKIVEYRQRFPLLLRLRDSPLKILHDPHLPYSVVQDWYSGIALDYFEEYLDALLSQWNKDSDKRRHDDLQLFDRILHFVDGVHLFYKRATIALEMEFPRGSALASSELKHRVKRGCINMIKERLSSIFYETRDKYLERALNCVEDLFKLTYHTHHHLTFSHLFVPGLKNDNASLERIAQKILDTDLPGLIDQFDLSNDILDALIEKEETVNDVDNSIPIETWLPDIGQITSVPESHLKVELKHFAQISRQLKDMDLLPDWIPIVQNRIAKRLSILQWTDDMPFSMVQIHLKWLHIIILPWLSYYTPPQSSEQSWYDFLRIKIRAEHILYEAMYNLRIDSIFDIIRDYPETKNVILDFRVLGSKCGLLDHLRDILIGELKERLLHQGASAINILQQYILCLQCLALIDPSCNIIPPVIELVENYTKTARNDIGPGVVEMIRNPGEYDLTPTDDLHIYVFQPWEVDRNEAPPSREDKPAQLRRLQRKMADMRAMLMSACYSLKDFIKYYTNELGKALLKIKNYDAENEFRMLEMLKRNFPPGSFTRCDIMLKDVEASRRLDKNIHENKDVDQRFHPTIMSHIYWPGGDEEDEDDDMDEDEPNLEDQIEQGLRLWPDLGRAIEDYENEYKKIKASRSLKFLPYKGLVTLELEFETDTITVDARQEEAIILSLFKTKEDRYTQKEIAEIVGMEKGLVTDCLEVWLKQGILQLSAKGYFYLTKV